MYWTKNSEDQSDFYFLTSVNGFSKREECIITQKGRPLSEESLCGLTGEGLYYLASTQKTIFSLKNKRVTTDNVI